MWKADPTHNEARMKLAEIYEILNEPRKALDSTSESMLRITNFADFASFDL